MRKPLQIRLVQLNQAYGPYLYLPYSAALLEGYVKTHAPHPEQYHFHPPLIQPAPVKHLVQELLSMNVVGLSTYAWNYQLSLAVAKALKQLNPEVLIIMGGPMAPEKNPDFLFEHPYIDICCHGEGEQALLNILQAYPTRDWEGISNISYLDKGQDYRLNPRAPRLKDINQIPSPFLNGFYDALMATKPDQKWIALWETNRGCPFSCTFCDWGAALQSKIYRYDMARLEAEIEWFAQHQLDMIWCCDANFGILKRDIAIADKMVQVHQESGFPKNFYVQSTKNATERAFTIQQKLFQAGLNQNITLSLQSVTPDVLTAVKRDNISSDTFRELQHRFQAEGIATYTDVLIGLPGETQSSFYAGIDKMVADGQHHLIQFYNLYVLPNSEMGDPAYQAKYGIETVETPFLFLYEPAQPREIQEYQSLVVKTHSMSRKDWCQMRIFGWWCDILYFKKKLLQLPLLLLQNQLNWPLSRLILGFMHDTFFGYPVLGQIQAFFKQMATGMLQGQPGFYAAGQPPVWVMVDEFILSQLAEGVRLRAFFEETLDWLNTWLQDENLPAGFLEEALELCARRFLCRFAGQDFELMLKYNLWTIYQQLLQGQNVQVSPHPQRITGVQGQINAYPISSAV